MSDYYKQQAEKFKGYLKDVAERADTLARENAVLQERVRVLTEALTKVDSELLLVRASDSFARLPAQHRRALDDARMYIRAALTPAAPASEGREGE